MALSIEPFVDCEYGAGGVFQYLFGCGASECIEQSVSAGGGHGNQFCVNGCGGLQDGIGD
jgi:hypothetical protein